MAEQEFDRDMSEEEVMELEREINDSEPVNKPGEGFKLFGLYDVSNIIVKDPGMKRYINLEPKLVVKSYGRIREK